MFGRVMGKRKRISGQVYAQRWGEIDCRRGRGVGDIDITNIGIEECGKSEGRIRDKERMGV